MGCTYIVPSESKGIRTLSVTVLGALILAWPTGAHAARPSPATARLYSVPHTVAAACKTTAREFKIRVLCPTVLPRATTDLGLLPPPKVALLVEKGDGIFGGFSFIYGVPWSPSLARSRDSPAAFLHFELDRTSVRYFGGTFDIHQDARHVYVSSRPESAETRSRHACVRQNTRGQFNAGRGANPARVRSNFGPARPVTLTELHSLHRV